MCDLELYRARIGCFCGAVLANRSQSLLDSQVSEETARGTGVSVSDVVSAYLSCWIVVALVSTLHDNISSVLNPSIVLLNEKPSTTTARCVESVSGGVYHCDSFDLPLSAMHVPALVVFTCAANTVYSMWRLRLANDVELHPGPATPPGTNTPPEKATNNVCDKSTENRVNIPCSSDEFFGRISAIVQQQIDAQTSVIKGELGTIREELTEVKDRCERIDSRCDRLEKDQQDLVDSVKVLHDEAGEGKFEMNTLKETVQDLKEELSHVRSELDKLESFSRRDNLRFYGLPQSTERESFDTCAEVVIDSLNEIDQLRTWSHDDIVRAHRVGFAEEGKARPMIVRFTRWKDKMFILTNKEMREKLNSIGVRVSNDLTRSQYDIVTRARQSGCRAVFKKGRMTLVPDQRRPVHQHTVPKDADDRASSADRTHNTVGVTSPLRGQGQVQQPTNAQNKTSLVSAEGGREMDEGGGNVCVSDPISTSAVQLAAERGGEGSDEGGGGLNDARVSNVCEGQSTLVRCDENISSVEKSGDGTEQSQNTNFKETCGHVASRERSDSKQGGVGQKGGEGSRKEKSGERGGRRGSMGRQPGLRSYLSNQTGDNENSRPSRQVKKK